jgi:predicted nucleotidyltransferase
MLKYVEETINLLSKALSEKFNDFHGLYLYGIFTDGKPHPDEDIEIAAVFDVENKEKREFIWPIVGKIETDLDVFIDLHPITMEDLKKDEEYYEQVVIKGVFFSNCLDKNFF